MNAQRVKEHLAEGATQNPTKTSLSKFQLPGLSSQVDFFAVRWKSSAMPDATDLQKIDSIYENNRARGLEAASIHRRC